MPYIVLGRSFHLRLVRGHLLVIPARNTILTLQLDDVTEKTIYSFESSQRSSEHLRKFSVKFRKLRKIVGNPKKSLGRFGKSRS